MTTPAEERIGVSEARANLTEVIARVRLLGNRVVFTRRDKPQAALVSYDFYEQALRDRAMIQYFRERATQAPGEELKPDVRNRIRFLTEQLDAAERLADTES